MTKRSSIVPPGKGSSGNLADHTWADPPTAVCGQPGE